MNMYCPKQQQIPQATPRWDLLKMTLSPLSLPRCFWCGGNRGGRVVWQGQERYREGTAACLFLHSRWMLILTVL